VPEANLFTLPALYGLPQNTFFGLLQGPTGAAINTSIEQRLAVKVLGRSIPLGFATTYTTDKLLHAPDDLRGLKIRVPGGSGPVVAMVHMGASPVTLPIADVPLALAQGAINGIQSTHETVASTSLWEVGIKHCYEDRAYLLLYTPLVSLEFWKRLSEQQQETLIALWAQVTSDIEAYARERQLQAKEVLLSKGVQCTEVNPLLLGEVRNQMQSSSLALADELKISEAVLNVLATQLQEDAP
jgi:C4-dicarboxylate-binding protein DctP